MSDRDAIEEGYSGVLQGLYRNLYDKLITNPPDDEKQAAEAFKRGVDAAREAKKVALQNLPKD